MAAELPEEQGVLAEHWAPQRRVPLPEREAPQLLAVKPEDVVAE